MSKVVSLFLAMLLSILFVEFAHAKQDEYKVAPFEATYCFFDGQECEALPTFIKVMTVKENSKITGYKRNERILSMKSVDEKASWQKNEVLIFREKYKKKYKKALLKYLEFADKASSEQKLFPRKKIASFKYVHDFQTFRTFSRFKDDHYLVIKTTNSRVVFNRINAERLLDFLNDWNFEGEIQAVN